MNVQNHDLGKRAGARLLALALVLALSACGGGGGSPGATVGTGNSGTGTGTGTTNQGTATVSVAFTNSSGQATNALTSANQLTVKATVRDATGRAVPNALVTFATDDQLAVFAPASGTALTDGNGVAAVTMRAASLASGGAGSVTVTASIGGATISGSGNYSVGATTLTFAALTASPSSIQAYGSTVLSVDLLAGNSKYTEQQVNVSFSSACVAAGKATLATVAATNNGTVQTVYRDQGCGNNDTITASAAGVAKSATVQLAIAPPAAASVQFVAATPTTQSIVIRGQGGNGRTETASLKYRVVDIFNRPLSGASVDFSSSTTLVTVNKSADTTDLNGEVITTVNSSDSPTSFRVKAALHSNPAVYTWSDTIVVTTGLPVPRAFSLSAEKYNIDRTVESTPDNPATSLQVMIADNFGNPVPDGTPVVFQTNMGAVGSSDKGGCITVNGGCSVAFRMQEPRIATPGSPSTPCNAAKPDITRPGVATVCASTTDGTNTVFARTGLFFSGNQAVNVYMDGTKLGTAATDLGTVKSDGAKVFALQINDFNNNPLPAGTKIAVVSMTNAVAAAALPGVVPNMAPGPNLTAADPPQGSSHAFTITSTQATNCTKTLDATFSVEVTTPNDPIRNQPGYASYIPFKLTFSCP
jgi:hypothetical protein